ncbi:MAG: hypothetical protein IJI22_05650 [Bacilli bacterium]|nr:hypothetical protein [Bacilli bacterium]
MNHIELNKNNKRITFYGSNSVIDFDKNMIDNLPLTGDEANDRLLIQKCIDDNNLKSSILYDGNTVYSFKKIVKEYRDLQKTGTLDKLTEKMYHFFTNACGDIAHYNINGFKGYYNNSLRNLESSLLSRDTFIPRWHSDLDKIFKELKIGKYYDEREYVDLDIVPINKLKPIVEELGWNVKQKYGFWDFEQKGQSKFPFKFSITTTDNKATEVTDGLKYYYNYFDKDGYIRQLIELDESHELNVSDIVHDVEYNMGLLSRLVNEITYRCKNEALILSGYENNKNYDLDLELER